MWCRVAAGPQALVAVVLLAGLGVGCGDTSGDDTAPYDAVDWVTGERVSVEDHRGDAVLLAGWATWCVPCERELPELDQLDQQRGDDGLTVIAVNLDEPAVGDESIGAMLDRLGVTLPVWRDQEQTLLVEFGGSLMPFSVLLDDGGEVVRTWNGAIDVDQPAFVAELDSLLG